MQPLTRKGPVQGLPGAPAYAQMILPHGLIADAQGKIRKSNYGSLKYNPGRVHVHAASVRSQRRHTGVVRPHT